MGNGGTRDDVHAVLLDFGGVFVLPDAAQAAAVLAPFGATPEPDVVDRAHYAGVRSRDVRRQSRWDYFHEYVRVAGVEPARVEEAAQALAGTRLRWTRLVPGSSEGLVRLAAAGVSLAIVSDSDGTVVDQARSTGVCQVGDGPLTRVDAVVDSAVVGVEKPDPALFTAALTEIGAVPEQALHVGDSVRADVEGALAAGVFPVHFDPYRTCGDDGHAHVRSLTEVAALVGRRQAVM